MAVSYLINSRDVARLNESHTTMDDHLISLGVDSDDENDWEEVEFPELQERTIEITLNAQPKASEDKR